MFLLLLAACGYPTGVSKIGADDYTFTGQEKQSLQQHWHYSEQPAGVVVVVHGFNLNPGAMTDMVESLVASDLTVLSVSLTGHEMALQPLTRIARFRHAEFSDWRRDVDEAMEAAALYAQTRVLPLYQVGYSLGGLLAVDYLNRRSGTPVERQVLLAPALSLRWTSWLLRPLGILPGLYIPSFAAARYQANSYLPLSAYTALYRGVSSFNSALERENMNLPTLLIINRGDELVSPSGLEKFIADNRLSQWHLLNVEKGREADSVPDHILVDRAALGQAWTQMINTMTGYLKTGEIPGPTQ